MNANLESLRKNRNYKSTFDHKPERLRVDQMNTCIVTLNSNISDLYILMRYNKADVNTVAKKITENVYIVLNMFNRMGVYPDYFYDAIVRMNVEYHKKSQNNTLKGDYELFDATNLSIYYEEEIKRGMEKGYYKIQSYSKKDINDNYAEMIPFFKEFNLSYGINNKEQCSKVFSEIEFNHQRIMDKLATSDDISEDIECLSRLLFEYMTFYVSLGINPKECLDEFIDTVEKTPGKQR